MLNTFDVAMCAAREAGSILSRYFNEDFAIRLKGVADIVTDADVAAERRIAAVIREAFPDHAILAEEENAGDINAEHLWVVDPLDGTTNFAHHIPHFAVSIAYLHHGKAECGVILNPIRDDLYVARRGHGATHNGKPIHVGDQQNLHEVLLGIGDEDSIRSFTAQFLSGRGFEVLEASDANAALEMMSDDVDVVVTDLGLPGMNGVDLCRSIHARYPSVGLVVVSGSNEVDAKTDALVDLGARFLPKPFHLRDLLAIVESLASGTQSAEITGIHPNGVRFAR